MRTLREWLALLAVVLVAMAACVVYGQSTKPVTLEWDCATCAADEVTEFLVYESTEAGTPGQGTWNVAATIPVTQWNAVEELTIDSGRHWFYVTARNAFAESAPSNVVSVNTARPRPVFFRIRMGG